MDGEGEKRDGGETGRRGRGNCGWDSNDNYNNNSNNNNDKIIQKEKEKEGLELGGWG